MKNRRFIQPPRDELHVDRQLLRAEGKWHGERGQTSKVERYGSTHHVCGRHLFTVDDVFLKARKRGGERNDRAQ